ncbi:MAG: DUF3575 domain-containing protein [Bacteroidota bacterium]|nr:DUF3575 domain-containing protein [Bacteroidota bacterium]
MKKVILITLSIMAMSMNAFCQTNSESTKKPCDNNEIRLNVASPIFGLPEINYERFINDNMGVGLTAAISLEKKDMEMLWMLLPYYRIYFGEKKASGFFIEGNMALVREYDYNSYNNNSYYNTYYGYLSSSTISPRSFNTFGCGAACGYKFLTRNGVTGEICIGAGRLFGNTVLHAYPRLGLCIGKRF